MYSKHYGMHVMLFHTQYASYVELTILYFTWLGRREKKNGLT